MRTHKAQPQLEKSPELQKLHTLIQKKLEDSVPPSHHKQTLKETQAARKIQAFWRKLKTTKQFTTHEPLKLEELSKFAEKFLNNGYETYLEMLKTDDTVKSDKETETLARLMFGRTIATIKPKSDKNFSIENPFINTKDSLYHRFNYSNERFRDDISNVALLKYDAQPNRTPPYVYIPISLCRNTPGEELLGSALENDEESQILKRPGEQLAFFRVCSGYAKEVSATGVIASPWQITQFAAPYIEAQAHMPPSAEGKMVAMGPQTISALKSSPLMKQLAVVAFNRNYPTHLLATCLRRMISGLPDTTNIRSIQRMYLFLNIALKFNKNHYERFSLFVYAILHEISLILHSAHKNGFNIDFKDFKSETLQDAISSFGLTQQCGATSAFKCIAAPAISGAHAFAMARRLAKRMSVSESDALVAEAVGCQYFEFCPFILRDISIEDSKAADIYFISAGPIVSNSGIHQGTNINNLIRTRILANGSIARPVKPVVIVVDATTALYQNLRIDADLHQHIYDGSISIIVHESRQKFGLLHSDQAQYGRVFGICGRQAFSPDVIRGFEQNAEEDLHNHLDMMIGSDISIMCGSDLERIKQRHFDNGFYYADILRQLTPYELKIHSDEMMLRNRNETCFFTTTEQKLISCLEKQFVARESFGHFTTTVVNMDSGVRISPNASDQIDTLIDATQTYLAVTYPMPAFIEAAREYVLNQRNHQPDQALEVIVFGMFMALRQNSYFLGDTPAHSADECRAFLSIIHDVLEVAGPTMVGRKSYQALRAYYESVQDSFRHLHGSAADDQSRAMRVGSSSSHILSALNVSSPSAAAAIVVAAPASAAASMPVSAAASASVAILASAAASASVAIRAGM
jgi:hypothetical protein